MTGTRPPFFHRYFFASSITDLYAEASLLRVKFRREQHLLKFMFDQAQNPNLLRKKSSYAIRTQSSNNKLLKTKRPHTEKYKKSLAYLGPKKWNKLPEAFHHAEYKCSYKLLVSNMVRDKYNKSVAAGANVADIC